MTKAKTKSRRVWVVLDYNGHCFPDNTSYSRADAISGVVRDTDTLWRILKDDGWNVAPATLTWTPPAKAKKRSAKR